MKPLASEKHPFPRGFTLIEVILAIGITAGILMVVLFFYRQSETLRDSLLAESSRLSAVRLVMERLSGDLSASRRVDSLQQGLAGGPDRIQFVRLDFPKAAAWTNQASGVSAATPFRLVSYSLSQSGADTGLIRSEEPLSSRPVPAIVDPSLEPAEPAPPPGMPAGHIQFLRFRYYDGANWLESWTAPLLPIGVEVSLGGEPLPPELTAEEYPFELYRRVIYLPNYAAGTALTETNILAMEGLAP